MSENFTLAFSLAPGIGPKGFQKLLRLFGTAQKAWKGSSSEFKKAGIGKVNFAKFDAFRKTFDTDEYLNKLHKARVEFIEYGSKFYPERLTKLDAPPIGLYIKGNRNLLLSPSPKSSPVEGEVNASRIIAVVGARKITSYGSQVTSSLVSELVSNGFTIVSGMALGVDGVAHKAAIENKGSTIAVLGCGVDCPYPRENERLYEEIIDSKGLIISEYPLGMPASPGTFPSRNRIIAGISSSILITEAAEDSGSLITAQHAVEQGKKVFAVPGNVTSQMSRGTLKLLKHGAILVSSAADILETLNVKSQQAYSASFARPRLAKLSKYEQRILSVLENEAQTIDEISKLTNIKIGKLSTILSEMEIKGLIRNRGGKFSVI